MIYFLLLCFDCLKHIFCNTLQVLYNSFCFLLPFFRKCGYKISLFQMEYFLVKDGMLCTDTVVYDCVGSEEIVLEVNNAGVGPDIGSPDSGSGVNGEFGAVMNEGLSGENGK